MLLQTLLLSSIVVFALVTTGFILAVKLKNNGIADVLWGIGFIVITYTTLFVNGIYSIRQLVVTVLVLFWGVRLAAHIFMRNKGKKEDFRYAAWRAQWGKAWVIKSYLYVFLLQGFFMLLVALPVLFTNTYPGPTIGLLDRIGVVMWLIGFYFEAVGDWQLMQFKKKASNKGQIMNKGLWKYTRHPNYFGESLMWWGIYVIALSNMSAWWTFIGPLFITFSLLKVSGVTMLERKYKGDKAYREYQKTTSAFFPWFPSKS